MNLENIFKDQLEHILAKNISGYDPHDGLNTFLFEKTYLNRFKWIKIAFLQFHKRSFINTRQFFGIKKHKNPKAVALVVTSLIQRDDKSKYKKTIYDLLNWLENNKSHFYKEYCWGYPFDWQARAFFQPKDFPTVVATSFVAQAFLDAYETFRDEKFLDIAVSSANFIINHLNRTQLDNGFAFSYSPSDHSVVFNATALGARHLARCYYYTKDEQYYDLSIKAICSLQSHQNDNGSWTYGILEHHKFIDSFHTGYNLECLYDVMKYLNIDTFHNIFEKGMKYYIKNLFTEDGIPKYYHNNNFPIDSHSPAQLMVTVNKTGYYAEYKSKVDLIFNWWIKNMYSDNKKHFFYQKHRFYLNRIDYMRWTQCWALVGIAAYIQMNHETD